MILLNYVVLPVCNWRNLFYYLFIVRLWQISNDTGKFYFKLIDAGVTKRKVLNVSEYCYEKSCSIESLLMESCTPCCWIIYFSFFTI